MKVAECNEATKGAKTIDAAKTKCPIVHAVNRLGFRLENILTKGARLGGGRAVNEGFSSSSGDLTNHGREMDPMNVTIENTIRDILPILPMSLRVSFDSLTAGGAS